MEKESKNKIMEGEFFVWFGAMFGEINCGTLKDANTYIKFCVI
jgi:hypothetical protein